MRFLSCLVLAGLLLLVSVSGCGPGKATVSTSLPPNVTMGKTPGPPPPPPPPTK